MLSRFFQLVYREVVSHGNELLKKDFCLVSAAHSPLHIAQPAMEAKLHVHEDTRMESGCCADCAQQ